MGYRVSKSFVQGAECEIFLAMTYFCSSYITEEEINDIEKLLYLCYLVVLLSNNPCIESIMKPCVSKNQKGIFAM